MITKFIHIAASAVAVILIIIGLITLPMPIPVGLILIVLGVALLITTNAAFAIWLRGFRQRHPDMDDKIRAAEKWLPGFLRTPLDKTRPEGDESAD